MEIDVFIGLLIDMPGLKPHVKYILLWVKFKQQNLWKWLLLLYGSSTKNYGRNFLRSILGYSVAASSKIVSWIYPKMMGHSGKLSHYLMGCNLSCILDHRTICCNKLRAFCFHESMELSSIFTQTWQWCTSVDFSPLTVHMQHVSHDHYNLWLFSNKQFIWFDLSPMIGCKQRWTSYTVSQGTAAF